MELKIQWLALKTGKFQLLLYCLQSSFWRNFNLTALISVVWLKSLITNSNDLFKKSVCLSSGHWKMCHRDDLLLQPHRVSEWWHFGWFSFKVRLSISPEKESLGESFNTSKLDNFWFICSDWNCFFQEIDWMPSWSLFQPMWLYDHVGCFHLFLFWDGRESPGIAPGD